MQSERRNQPFDVVMRARHYNDHPSGIEVIEVVRYLPFSLGNVFKYVVRRKGKEPVRSLQSALWYLNDHEQNVHSIARPAHPAYLAETVRAFAWHEEDPDVSRWFEQLALYLDFYALSWLARVYRTRWVGESHQEHLADLKITLKKMIVKEQAFQVGPRPVDQVPA